MEIYFARVNRAPTSSAATATASNNQRKLARDSNGTYHQVFETNQEIWYARKTTTDTEWNNYQRLNSGTVTGNSSPCIAERGGKIYVAWQELNVNTYNVYFHKSTDGGASWPDANRQTLATSVGANPPLPVIISPAASKLTVVYRASTALRFRISTNDGSSWSGFSSVPSTGANDNSPTLAPTLTYGGTPRSALVYANTSSVIYYRYYRNGPDSTGWSASVKNLSQIVPGTYNSYKSPSIAPSGTSGDRRLHVVWEARSGTTGYNYVIIHRKATDWGTWPNVYSVTFYEYQKLPSITGLHDDTAELLFQHYTQNQIYKKHYDGSSWNGYPFIVGSGVNPSVFIGHTSAKYVWTNGTSSPYQIKTSTETLSKAGQLTAAYHRSIAVIDTATSAWLEVRLDKLSVKTKTGNEYAIPFENAKEDEATLTPANAFINLSSPPVLLPADAESLLVSCQVSAQGLSAIKNASSIVSADILLSGKTGATLGLQALRVTSENLEETKLLLAAPISAFAGSEISLRTQISGIANNSSLIASLGHIYEFVEESQPEVLGKTSDAAIPPKISLAAHPNPFNPSTQIRFSLPSESLVTLRIYNITGQTVRELLHEQQRAAGEHTVLWDGRDGSGRAIASGIYFLRFESGNHVKVSKLTLVR